MQKVSVANRKFLVDHNDLLQFHIECILKSGMILDEDMNLLLTFWDNKLQSEAYTLLLKPGEDFLKSTIVDLSKIVDEIKQGMSQVCEFVPISEGQFICSLEWNIDNCTNDNFDEMKKHFDKLTNLYLLITSNFLGCIGLSMCVQLWKEPCNFANVFTRLIPALSGFLRRSRDDVRSRFNVIRFNLCDRTAACPRKSDGSASDQFLKPLHEFLLHVQITFDKGRHLQMLLEDERGGSDYEDVVDIVQEAWKNIEISKDCLQILTRRIDAFTSKNRLRKDGVVKVSLPTSVETLAVVESATCEDVAELKDEEYNLSIHGSDNDCIDFIEDLEDMSSNEDLSTLLLELKKKLQEKHKVQQHDDATVPDLVPAKIPIVNHSMDVNSLLKTVMLTAQKLNRSEEFQFGFNMFPEIPRPFNTTYRCFSVAMLPGNERQDVERGGKIIMPPSALEQLTRLNINYPMQFKVVNKNTSRTSHCGVLEFVADEGKVYLPLWMMQNLVLEEGDFIQIESVSLPVGTFAKFQPLSPEFLDITNPKAVLENCLRTFSCLTSGDVIAVKYNQRAYELCVLETQPGNAISIIECDMNVEFAAPVGYKETEHVKPPEEGMAIDPTELMPEPTGFVAFRGQGNRLDGKRRKDSGSAENACARPVYVRGIPDYDYQIGTLKFLRQIPKSSTESKEEDDVAFKAFSGEGFSLKRR